MNAKTGFSPLAAVLVVVLFLLGREESPKIGAMLDAGTLGSIVECMETRRIQGFVGKRVGTGSSLSRVARSVGVVDDDPFL